MRPSYEAASVGMTSVLKELQAYSVRRRQRNVVVKDVDGCELVSLRIHLIFETAKGRIGAFMYFSDKKLTVEELEILETSVVLAVRTIDPAAIPVIVMVRGGAIRPIDTEGALSSMRVRFLRSESVAYREAWAVAA